MLESLVAYARSAVGAVGSLGMPAGIVAGGMAGLLATAAAADDTDSTIEQRLRAMQEEITSLRGENDRMRSEIDDLRLQTDDDWLTEQRAEEIRGIVADVLADADTRASNLQSGMMAGWSDGFFLASPDGRFKLELGGLLQVRWAYNYRDEPRFDRHRQGFEVTRAQLIFRGHVFTPDLQYYVMTEPTRDEPGLVTGLFFLKDAWVSYEIGDDWSVRLGQFKLPYSREELVRPEYQLAVERSLISENLNVGRSQGIELRWAGDRNRVAIAYSDGPEDQIGQFGLFSGTNPKNTPALQQDTEWSFTGRWEHLVAGEWRQFRDMTSPPGDEFGMLFGWGVHASQNEYGNIAGSRDEHRWLITTLDLSVEWGGANLFTSFFYNYLDHGSFGFTDIFGFTIQGGVYVTPKTELFARYEYGHYDARGGNFSFADLSIASFGANYYADGHDVKLTADIGFTLNRLDTGWLVGNEDNFQSITNYRVMPNDDFPQIVFRTQLQLMF